MTFHEILFTFLDLRPRCHLSVVPFRILFDLCHNCFSSNLRTDSVVNVIQSVGTVGMKTEIRITTASKGKSRGWFSGGTE